MHVAAMDAVRVSQGVVGAMLVLAAAGVLALIAVRWRREQVARRPLRTGSPALARVGGPVVNPTLFGGGFPAALSVRRRDAVSYGYLAVVEEYVSDDDAHHWCTLTLPLPGNVPELVVDHRVAVGRPGVPGSGAPVATGDAEFDSTYVVAAASDNLGRVLGEAVRRVLVARPVQRFALRGSVLTVRTFDGAVLDDDVIAGLTGFVAALLGATPSFVTAERQPAVAGSGAPLAQGLYGPQPAADLP